MPSLRVALYQGPSGIPESTADSLAALAAAARRAAGSGARLLLTGELYLTGYALGEDVHRRAESASGPGAEAVARIAAETGIAIGLSLLNISDGAR
ncbi:hypothetical protein ADK38_40115, partial [Streptomyces varsoviensis]